MKYRGFLFYIVGLILMGIIYTLNDYSATADYLEIKDVTPKCESTREFNDQQNRILKVPTDFPSIATAVASSKDGDWVIISPGTYFENEIVIDKAITISSEWKITGDESIIEKTIIDSEDKVLFTIIKDSVEVSGLMLINGNHTLDIEARVSIIHNHFINNLDGISFESNGGGYVGYNVAENDRDDPLDIDAIFNDKYSGSDILVEHNVFINSNDDGIEIRLFKPHNQNINYTIRYNKFIGSKNAGIQLISYDEFTGKVFNIHHNVFINCKTGLGCMEGARTREDLSGATKMDEIVYFYNNTIIDCEMGATGGNRIIAFNNLIAHNSLGGFKQFGEKSVIRNNLFFDNGSDDLTAINRGVVVDGNIFNRDPLIDKSTFYPSEHSPSINAGITTFDIEDAENPEVSRDDFSGKAPDIGAFERGLFKPSGLNIKSFHVYAGGNHAVRSPLAHVILAGRILNSRDRSMKCYWKQEDGPLPAVLTNSDQLVARAEFSREGIYDFSLNCSDLQSTASDVLTIRYIKGGEGKQLFLSGDPINIFEAQDFAYTYGNIKINENKHVELSSDVAESGTSQIEFSIGMAEAGDFQMWLLVKSLSQDGNKIQIEFNQRDVGELSIGNSRDFHWVKVPAKITTTAGQWQLLMNNLEGTVLLDRILLTKNMNYIPQ